jgi:hypothetical protein
MEQINIIFLANEQPLHYVLFSLFTPLLEVAGE